MAVWGADVKLQAITVMGVREAWPFVRKGLDSMLEKHQDRWLPEDVYFELMAGTAFLYIINHEDEELGFMVVKKFVDFDGLALFVWIIHAENGSMKENDRWKDVMAELDALAKNVGAKRIRHYSPRGGFGEIGAFDLKMHIYEREV